MAESSTTTAVDQIPAGTTRQQQSEPPSAARARRRGARDPRTLSLGDLYPFESHYLELGGPRMHYLDEGDGPPVLMLHGNPTWSFHFRGLVKALRPSYRLIVPDHVGSGLSDKPLDYPYTLDTHIRNLERLVDSLELDSVTVVVHDWGGPIGFGWAARHPERAERFVVFNSAAFLGGILPKRIAVCRYPVLGELLVRGINGFVRASFWMACVKRLPRAVRRGYLLPYDGYAHRIGVLSFVRDIPVDPSVQSYPVMEGVERSLPQLADRPMAIFWGMQDFCFTQAFLDEWTRRFPQAAVHRYEQAGHYVLEDAFEEIEPELGRFLDESARE